MPWFATLFGRDSLITSFQTLSFVRGIAEETLRLLAGRLGQQYNDERDEEPGKVLHELRVGEPANLGETPFARYYGSVDATPLFLCLLGRHADWSGSLDLFRELRGPAEAALEWIDRYADLDGDGLVEYQRRSPHGLVTQGWKDSEDGIPDDEGEPLTGPVALVEVQGYVIRAKRLMARMFELDGDGARAERLRDEASAVEAALERFWLPDQRCYAIALDGDKRPGSGLTSNQGHLLWSNSVSDERARGIRDVLMSDEMFTGWGVRTLASSHPAYNPVGYHTGSVWPHDSALIAFGLRRYGFDEDFTADLRGAARGGLALRRLPPAGAVRGLPARGVRRARALPGGVPAAGVGGGLDPIPAQVGTRPEPGRARQAARDRAAVTAALAEPGRGHRAGAGRRQDRPRLRARGRARDARGRATSTATPRWCSRSRPTAAASGTPERAHRRALDHLAAGGKARPVAGAVPGALAVFQLTMQPRCVQRADSSCSVPSSSR